METALLLTAAFIAGALNAVAGGGSFLTLPALVFTGMPPVAANATGTARVAPAGTAQTLTLPAATKGPLYVALFSFDQASNMSAMSNVAVLSTPGSR